MVTLQALLDDRTQSAAEERSAKQASRARLVADPRITVTSKTKKNLCVCVCFEAPPPRPMGGVHGRMVNGW